jgi:putative nucleotidyltransferase with HDIG domain
MSTTGDERPLDSADVCVAHSESQSPEPNTAATSHKPNALSKELHALLERAFGVSFTILDGESGCVLEDAADQPTRDWTSQVDLCREIARRGCPEFIDDEAPLLTLALPLPGVTGEPVVAVALFLARHLDPSEDLSQQAALLEMSAENVLNWARRQTPWTAESLVRMSDMTIDSAEGECYTIGLRHEVERLSESLAASYEESSLLYRLTQNMKLSKSKRDLGQTALDWLKEVVPASGLAIQFMPPFAAGKSPHRPPRTQPVFLTCGESLVDSAEFSRLIEYLGSQPQHQPLLVHRSNHRPDWPCPQIRNMVAVRLAEGEHLFGWLAAFNHTRGGDFGAVEISLLNSVATVLSVHASNIEAYRDQSGLLAGIVRALVSAIDAKDPFTYGHSDRVARIAVRLAEEMGCDAKTLSMLYLAGLLHDVGKIGVEESVLQKQGTLTDEEYNHVKQHVTIGRRILSSLARREDILPVVLHHHESWDGGGYPDHLQASRIPLVARIVAVADAFDAMCSERPYRHGIPDEKVDEILRAGAGNQWDPKVVDAYFRAREDIHRIYNDQEPARDIELMGLV